MSERKFPQVCPKCRRLIAVACVPHCPTPGCPWLVCEACGAQFDEAGRWVRQNDKGKWESGKPS